jgi:hypothetical protein
MGFHEDICRYLKEDIDDLSNRGIISIAERYGQRSNCSIGQKIDDIPLPKNGAFVKFFYSTLKKRHPNRDAYLTYLKESVDEIRFATRFSGNIGPKVLSYHSFGRSLKKDAHGELQCLVVERAHRNAPTIAEFEYMPNGIEFIANRLGHIGKMLHQDKTAHRDIKPSNVLLIPRPNEIIALKLWDFALSTTYAEAKDHLTFDDGSAVIQGTAGYLSPELLIGGIEDIEDEDQEGIERFVQQTDIYAFGMTLLVYMADFHPLTRERLLLEEIGLSYFSQDLQKHANILFSKDYQGLIESTLRADAPSKIKDLALQCIDKDLEKRIKTFDEFLDKLAA